MTVHDIKVLGQCYSRLGAVESQTPLQQTVQHSVRLVSSVTSERRIEDVLSVEKFQLPASPRIFCVVLCLISITLRSCFTFYVTRQWRIQDFPDVGAPTYDFAKISQKLHEIERI